MTRIEELSIAAIVVSTIALIALERAIPYTRPRRLLRDGFVDDLALYTIAQSYVLGIVIFSWLIPALDSVTGLARAHYMARWPLWLQIALFLFSHDLYIYWMHRWQHRNKYLWRIHEAHHSPRDVDWLSGSRSHAIEILVNQTVEFAPMLLLGAAPQVLPIKGAISAIWGMYIHANLDVRTGWLQKIVNGPEMHRWHHTPGKGMRSNFSTKLAFWDWLFGTAYFPVDVRSGPYGIGSWFPKHYVGQILYAFRPFRSRSAPNLPP